MSQHLVRASGIDMVYRSPSGPVHALQSVDLTVATGEFVSLIGPSGCGKSTLLHVIGGMRKPTSGSVTIADREMNGPQPDKVAFVFQDYSLYPWLTVAENVEFPLRIRGIPKSSRREAAEHYLDLVGLLGFASSHPVQLSGGMQQRVAIARALCTKPEVLLMDEPFGALDEQTRMVLGEELARIIEKTGVTIVFVTHSLSEAVYLSDRVVVMSSRPGRIKEELHVSEPRPRSSDFVTSPVFSETRNRLFDLLHDEVQSAAEAELAGQDAK